LNWDLCRRGVVVVAVGPLDVLDPAAIGALEKAVKRKDGNGCLREDAAEAIEYLRAGAGQAGASAGDD
jgi:hypothetical protein